MIQSIQKVIKIGSSGGVTIPAKEMRREDIAYGDEVKVTIEPAYKPHDKLMDEYQEFVQEYGTTLKNLADR
ncbi:MAG TPA: AbrB/MazE/SpoVT family DNA-binding domain-containing protein [Candidatus Saccharimonadales bacterium]|nr:AbrB/MazE/SpoVT family DNA-binding domain-containing protein [Candidatus Saccharimonadales bacterium]